MTSPLRTCALVAVAALVVAPSASVAQPAPVPPYPMPPQVEYPAPLSQTTQPSYVPQSVALSGPEVIKDTDEDRGPPPGYTAVWRTRKGLLIGGGITFGVAYSFAILTAAEGADSAEWSESGENESASMWIPIVGPFLQMTQDDQATEDLGLAIVGGAQVVGAVLLYYGLTSKKRVFVRNDLVGNLSVSPMAGNGASGMMVGGRF
jgi:hypothetical protein